MLGAALNPRLMLALGLMATSVINVAFGFTSGVAWWTLLWAVNGGIQVGRVGLSCMPVFKQVVYNNIVSQLFMHAGFFHTHVV